MDHPFLHWIVPPQIVKEPFFTQATEAGCFPKLGKFTFSLTSYPLPISSQGSQFGVGLSPISLRHRPTSFDDDSLPKLTTSVIGMRHPSALCAAKQERNIGWGLFRILCFPFREWLLQIMLGPIHFAVHDVLGVHEIVSIGS